MMVMVGYPDVLLKPEAVDKEYEVGLPPGLFLPSLGFTRPLAKTPREPTTTTEKDPQPSADGP